MIITRTPLRVSLFGGSTDYESFFSDNESLIIGFGINKYCYLAVRKTPTILDYKTKISYSKTEIVDNNNDIQHDGVRGCLSYLKIKHGVEISYNGDLPAQTGTGSSSSFVVGLLNALHAMRGYRASKKTLADQSILIERKLLDEAGGIQDQIWAAYGGVSSIHIRKDGSFHVKPLPVCEHFLKDFMDRSVLIYSGRSRKSFEISKSHESPDSLKAKHNIKNIARDAYQQFLDSNIDNVATLLDKSWQHKKQISSLISGTDIDTMYSSLCKDGMIGGKLLGSGGSGFIFGILDKDVDKKVFKRKYKNRYVNFNFDLEGSKIINE
mgnify:CR=1 FL=1